MEIVKSDFENRKKEIDNYIKYLKIIDSDVSEIHYENKIEVINSEFQTTLIANTFLILYNLIESTVSNAIKEIYDNIEYENLTYKEISEELQTLWVKYKTTEKLKENNFRQDTLRNYITEVIQNILDKEYIVFSREWINFSGNLDAQKIRDIAKDYGFATSSNGRKLVEIKNKRNRLAHGEQTFYNVGRNFSVNDIEDFTNDTFNYLTDVIEKVEKFIDEKCFIQTEEL